MFCQQQFQENCNQFLLFSKQTMKMFLAVWWETWERGKKILLRKLESRYQKQSWTRSSGVSGSLKMILPCPTRRDRMTKKNLLNPCKWTLKLLPELSSDRTAQVCELHVLKRVLWIDPCHDKIYFHFSGIQWKRAKIPGVKQSPFPSKCQSECSRVMYTCNIPTSVSMSFLVLLIGIGELKGKFTKMFDFLHPGVRKSMQSMHKTFQEKKVCKRTWPELGSEIGLWRQSSDVSSFFPESTDHLNGSWTLKNLFLNGAWRLSVCASPLQNVETHEFLSFEPQWQYRVCQQFHLCEFTEISRHFDIRVKFVLAWICTWNHFLVFCSASEESTPNNTTETPEPAVLTRSQTAAAKWVRISSIHRSIFFFFQMFNWNFCVYKFVTTGPRNPNLLQERPVQHRQHLGSYGEGQLHFSRSHVSSSKYAWTCV